MAARRRRRRARGWRDDGVVASLLLMHGLYPVPLEDRVREALDSVRPYMESHGGDVELLGIAGRRRADPARGPLRRLRGVGVDARARDPPGARGVRARPGGARGRGRARGAHARAAARRDPAADGGRRAGARARAAPARAARTREEACELCGLADLRRAQAPDPPRRAPDRVRVRRPAGRCAPATPSSARSATAASGSRSCAITDEQWAAFGIPIGLAFFMISSVTGSVIALYPSPAGRDGVRAGPGRVGGRVRRQPGARARARLGGADRQPARRRAAAA